MLARRPSHLRTHLRNGLEAVDDVLLEDEGAIGEESRDLIVEALGEILLKLADEESTDEDTLADDLPGVLNAGN